MDKFVVLDEFESALLYVSKFHFGMNFFESIENIHRHRNIVDEKCESIWSSDYYSRCCVQWVFKTFVKIAKVQPNSYYYFDLDTIMDMISNLNPEKNNDLYMPLAGLTFWQRVAYLCLVKIQNMQVRDFILKEDSEVPGENDIIKLLQFKPKEEIEYLLERSN